MTKAYDEYSFGEAGRASYDFFWNEFADWYGGHCPFAPLSG